MKIAFAEFMSSSIEAKEEVDNQLRSQRMIIIENVPEISRLRKQLFDLVKKFPPPNDVDFSTIENILNFRGNNGVKYDNRRNLAVLTQLRAENFDDHLVQTGYSLEFLPDLCEIEEPIEGYFATCRQIENIHRTFAVQLMNLLDIQIGLSSDKVPLSSSVRDSPSNLCRTFFIRPVHSAVDPHNKSVEQRTTLQWHYDNQLVSMHIKDMYLIADEVNSTFVDVARPGESGLMYRFSDGQNYFLELKENEVMIQSALGLTLLSNGRYPPQAHCVVSPRDSNIGRLSFAVFIQPRLNTIMAPSRGEFTDTDIKERILAPNIWDRDLPLMPTMRYHWYPSVDFCSLQQNQILHQMLNIILRHLIQKEGLVLPVLRCHLRSLQLSSSLRLSLYYSLPNIISPKDVAQLWMKHYVSRERVFSFMVVTDDDFSTECPSQNLDIAILSRSESLPEKYWNVDNMTDVVLSEGSVLEHRIVSILKDWPGLVMIDLNIRILKDLDGEEYILRIISKLFNAENI